MSFEQRCSKEERIIMLLLFVYSDNETASGKPQPILGQDAIMQLRFETERCFLYSSFADISSSEARQKAFNLDECRTRESR